MILWSVVLFVACKQNYLSRTPFSPILRLLLLVYGYCYVNVSFERFKFYWLSKFSTDYSTVGNHVTIKDALHSKI